MALAFIAPQSWPSMRLANYRGEAGETARGWRCYIDVAHEHVGLDYNSGKNGINMLTSGISNRHERNR